jgi:hypothetical protein
VSGERSHGSGSNTSPFAAEHGLTFQRDDKLWHSGPDSFVAIVIAGSARAPHPARQEVAEQAMQRLPKLLAEARLHLARFIDFDKLRSRRGFDLVRIEVGRDASSALDELDLLLSLDGDEDGVWRVRIRYEIALERFFVSRFQRGN